LFDLQTLRDQQPWEQATLYNKDDVLYDVLKDYMKIPFKTSERLALQRWNDSTTATRKFDPKDELFYQRQLAVVLTRLMDAKLLQTIHPLLPKTLINDGFHMFMILTRELFPSTTIFEAHLEKTLLSLSLRTSDNDIQQFITSVRNYLDLMESPPKSILPYLFQEFRSYPCKPLQARLQSLYTKWIDGKKTLSIEDLMTKVLKYRATLRQSGEWTTSEEPKPELVAYTATASALEGVASFMSNMQKNMDKRFNQFQNQMKQASKDNQRYPWKANTNHWSLVPPTNFDEIKTMNGRQYTWCTKCRRWVWTHKSNDVHQSDAKRSSFTNASNGQCFHRQQSYQPYPKTKPTYNNQTYQRKQFNSNNAIITNDDATTKTSNIKNNNNNNTRDLRQLDNLINDYKANLATIFGPFDNELPEGSNPKT
jgi:hypothetical protein